MTTVHQLIIKKGFDTVAYAHLSKELCVNCYTVDSIEKVYEKLETLNNVSQIISSLDKPLMRLYSASKA